MKYSDAESCVDTAPSDERESQPHPQAERPPLKNLLFRLGAIAAITATGTWLVDNYKDDVMDRTPPEDAVCTEYNNPYRQGDIDRADLYVDGSSNIRALGRRIAQIESSEQETIICFDGELNRAYASDNVDPSQMVSADAFEPYLTNVD